MKKEMIVKLHAQFEEMSHKWEETGTEFWLARDLMEALGYSKWENFQKVIDKAVTSCKNAGYDPGDHFLDVRKKVELGSGAVREINDIALTRYACYLIAQNGDPSKEPIAFAQTYFAVQTRKQEIIEKRLAELERIDARKKLTVSITSAITSKNSSRRSCNDSKTACLNSFPSSSWPSVLDKFYQWEREAPRFPA